ncbi:arylalkylamine N-acetyltransferase 1-like [Oratosquilla oratoria]|uniref:arylalkylamine N-acetyltransferase 1-like n=1 Tax=Oratosquilla oratoria TaxID=337810 RepID=UPI003F7620A7
MADIVYTPGSIDDLEEAVEFHKHNYCGKEPLTVSLRLSFEERYPWIMKGLQKWLTSEATVLARDRSKGNRLVGYLLATMLMPENRFAFSEMKEIPGEKMRIYAGILNHVESVCDYFKDGNVDKILELAVLCVNEEYKGQGIGGELVKQSEAIGRQLGAQLATTQATNIISQRVFEKLGFSSDYTLDYESYEADGKKVLDTKLAGDSTCIKAMSKRL